MFVTKSVAQLADVNGQTKAVIGAAAADKTFLLQRLQQRGADEAGDVPDPACEYVIPGADYLFMTGVTLINKTAPRLLDLAANATTVFVGPSVVMAPFLFRWGVDMLAGYAVVPSTGWGIVAQRPKAATLAPLNKLMRSVLYKTLPIALLMLVVIWWSARRIASPLRQLANGAHDMDKPETAQNIQAVKSWYFESYELKKAMLKGLGLLQRLQKAYVWSNANFLDYAKAQSAQTRVPVGDLVEIYNNRSQNSSVQAVSDKAVLSHQRVAEAFQSMGVLEGSADVRPLWDKTFNRYLGGTA